MQRAIDRSGPSRAASAGMLVLGMHRSGTTVLARLLAASGFDPGARVVAGSSGNEAGHWEDAYAVEIHERLLSGFGAAWNEPAALPDGWSESPAADRARDAIRAYLQDDRARHPAWVLKDPRASLFAPLWIDQASQAGIPLGAVLMLRHPMEVAASLAARDGMSLERGLWLWLEYTAAAAMHACTIPSMLLSYDRLLADSSASLQLLRVLPGGDLLASPASASAGKRIVDPALRHHAGAHAALPAAIGSVWDSLSKAVGKPLERGVVEAVFETFRGMQDLLQPLAADWRWRHRQVWERAARAEDLVARDAMQARRSVEQLQELVAVQGREVIDAVSTDIREMQATTQEAIRAHALLAGEYAELRRAAESRQLQWKGEQAQLHAALSQSGLELGSARESSRALAADRDRLQGALDNLTQSHAAATARLANLDAELHGLIETNRRLVSDHERAGSQAKELEAELRAMHQQQLSSLEAELQALRDDNFRLRRANEALAESAETLSQVLRSRSWRWSRPFRVAMRLLGGRWSSEDRRKLRELFARPAGAATFGVEDDSRDDPSPDQLQASDHAARALDGKVRLAEAGNLADVFVWSVIDWHFRTQRPQHLSRAMAQQGHRVFYVSNNFEDSASAGFRVEPLDDSGRLFQVHLNLRGRPAIYHGMPDAAQRAQLAESFACLLAWTATRASLSVVHHPFWNPLALSCPNARLVYDCMDHHAGFDNNAPAILRGEADLIAQADLVVVTSTDLEERIGGSARNIATVRNGCDYEFFAKAPAKVYRQADGRQVIGYFGAIAEWFDAELVRRVARAHPEAEVVLIGCDTLGAGALLASEPNLRMVGEVPYAELPFWLHGFDVCLLPFQVVPLTLATNPVKVYEYLAAGKPVVAVDLPEMAQFGDLVRTARDADSFVQAVTTALADGAGREQRQAFAAGQTWSHRARAFDLAVSRARDPRVSVIVLTYNNWTYTEACLESLDAAGDYGDVEIVVVDNASTDGTVDRLAAWVEAPAPQGQVRRLILNPENVGFAAGNNVGLQAATGDVLILLNNDTYVTPGWVRTLCAHFRSDATLGLLGPVTNNIGNEAKIEIAYTDMAGMVEQARRYTLAHPGQRHPMRTVAFFCVAMPRSVYESVGGLDECYGVGFFEDDDYCRRVERAGWTIACADDVFVHHHLSASFSALGDDTRQRLFERNKALYEARWGAWIPHAYRSTEGHS